MKPESHLDPELWAQVAPLTLRQRLDLADMFERWARQLRASVRAKKNTRFALPRVPLRVLRRN